MDATRYPLIVSFAASLIACAPGGAPTGRDAGYTPPPPGYDAGPGVVPPTGGECAGRPPTQISGRVTFPNGTLPVARALVYVPTDPAGEAPRSGACGECIDRSSVLAVTETGVDGSFTLAVPAGATTVVVQKGPFTRRLPVALTACADNPLAPEMTRLPRDATEGTVPRIAVVTGEYDHMETVLTRLGLASGVVEIVPGDPYTGDGGASLFRDRARLTSFDYVFVNCGAGIAEGGGYPGASSALSDPAVRENLRAFVEEGGRLYVTDLANDVLEATLPSAVDFGGGNGMTETPEPLDSAQNGPPMSGAVSAEVVDPDLHAWLGQVGALDPSGRMQVRGLELGWTMVQAINPERATTIVQGPLETTPRALTLTADRGCGRALFTSYHTLEEGGGGALSPQEMALAYLVLEIGNCIEEPSII